MDNSTANIPTAGIGQTVDDLMMVTRMHRMNFERRWYDNNFFDDGFHFRYLSRNTNKIIDLSERQSIYAPTRAIPKTSRQIRGVANLLLSQEPTPIVYPEKLEITNFSQDQQAYLQAKEEAKDLAKKQGWWIRDEWKQQDLLEKLAHMILLATKHGVSYLKIWADDQDEKICSSVRDAFDIYLMGDYNELEECPFVVDTTKTQIAKIKANPAFDKDQLSKISPDNKYASSEIKNAYMASRYGREYNSESIATLMLKEAFIKERVVDSNIQRIRAQKNGGEILKDKGAGDIVMRHTFVAGNVWLLDEYLNMNKYPLVDYRMEPGPLYQVPLIERFINQNKSLDSVVSRVERYTHTMAVGIYQKRSGEQYKITNASGGQVIEYDQAPLQQMAISPMPQFVFEFIGLLGSLIEEQGVTTSALGKIPAGVKANAAIESLKESEMQNLAMPWKRLKETVKRITERMLNLADDYFVTPKSVMFIEKGEPQYFDVIGSNALEKRKGVKAMEGVPKGVVAIKGDCHVDIQVESGMAYTREAEQAKSMELANYIQQATVNGFLPSGVMKVVVQQIVETYGFGAASEVVDAINKGGNMANLSDGQIQAIKIAVVEAMGDMMKKGVLPDQNTRIMESKTGMAEVLRESGLSKNVQDLSTVPDNPETAPIPYKDAPEDIKRQMEAMAGMKPSQGISPAATDQLVKHNAMQQSETQTVLQAQGQVHGQQIAEQQLKQKGGQQYGAQSKTKGG